MSLIVVCPGVTFYDFCVESVEENRSIKSEQQELNVADAAFSEAR